MTGIVYGVQTLTPADLVHLARKHAVRGPSTAGGEFLAQAGKALAQQGGAPVSVLYGDFVDRATGQVRLQVVLLMVKCVGCEEHHDHYRVANLASVGQVATLLSEQEMSQVRTVLVDVGTFAPWTPPPMTAPLPC